ncbi:MAG: anti-sigma factor [Steroidobacteraceae bacterium]|jgi:hypothetical protein|nr:anti-sigma factor [Steroidobacteraceae bacterium]
MNGAYMQDERILDLLTLQATEGLAADGAAELDRLLAAHPGADREVLERTAAALWLAGDVGLDEPLPPALRAKVQAQGEAWLASRPPVVAPGPRAPVTDLASVRAERAVATGVAAPVGPTPGGVSLGWWAAAAAVVLAIAGWYPRFAGDSAAPVAQAPVTLPAPVEPAPIEPVAPDLAAEREALVAAAAAAQRLVRWDWAGTPDPAAAGVRGDVVWDPERQQGYMRFVGLRSNDASVEQYQLWIFDAERDERFPVDGGVFDVPAGRDEVIVPIDARLAVAKPAAFAVTVEKPGGVVVSSRERIVVLAKAPA